MYKNLYGQAMSQQVLVIKFKCIREISKFDDRKKKV